MFIGNKLKMSKFKIFNYTELISFLKNYMSDIEVWGEDFNSNFLKIYNKVYNYFDCINIFYVLDKEDFNEEDEEVSNDFILYDYYLLILGVDTSNRKLFTFEWASD